jgi:DNA-binding LacI/PurR family transcriptional regulator
MAATIKDIARVLNISTSTVSYALNGGPRKVPDLVKQRVLSTAAELGYRPNRLAKSMVTGKTGTFGIVPPGTSIVAAVSPYFQLVLNGILAAAEEADHDVLVFTGFNNGNEDRFLDNVLDGRVDGLIFLAPPKGTAIFSHPELAKVPHVMTNCWFPASVPSVNCDNAAGIQDALAYLVDLGHRKIGMLCGKFDLDDGIQRYEAFVNFMTDAGLPIDPAWIKDGDFTPAGGYAAGQSLLTQDRLPTAVLCGNDEMAVGFVRAAAELKVSVPEQISVVGFDDSPMAASVHPPITTMRQPWKKWGEPPSWPSLLSSQASRPKTKPLGLASLFETRQAIHESKTVLSSRHLST